MMDRIGRKKTCAPALLLAGIACMLIIVLPAVGTLGVCACSIHQIQLLFVLQHKQILRCSFVLLTFVQDINALAITLSMTGKFAVAIAFGLIYLYTCELYPTIIRWGQTGSRNMPNSCSFEPPACVPLSTSRRTLAVGSGSMMCRVGSVVAPFCVYLADVWVYLPQVWVLSWGRS